MATSPPFLNLLQQLGRGGPPRAAGPGVPPPGPGLRGAQQGALTPPGNEAQDIPELKSRLGTLANRALTRSSKAAEHFIRAVQELEKGEQLLAELPAAPVAPPPAGFPQAGMGMLGTPPMGEMPMGMMG